LQLEQMGFEQSAIEILIHLREMFFQWENRARAEKR